MPNGLYFYGLMRANQDLDFGPIGLEHDGKPGRVYTLRVDSIAAVVSDFEIELEVPASGEPPRPAEIQPIRKNMKPYNDVICEVMKTTTIAPMRFGHVAESAEDIKKLLVAGRANIEAQLGRIEGHVEMDLQLKWAVDNFFEYFEDLHPDLRELRHDVFGSSDGPSGIDKLELGREFDARLKAHCEEQQQRVEEMFRSSCRELAARPPKSERVVVDLAVLVQREG